MLLRPAEARHSPPDDALEILWLSEADGAPRMAAELVKLCWCLLVGSIVGLPRLGGRTWRPRQLGGEAGWE